MINPTHCIGHVACKKACPFDAIELVFGTEKRGVDIPQVDEDFQTNVPGIYIAGELGGMGLVRNAITQGIEAVDSIAKLDGIGSGKQLDLGIVGAGPAGIGASLAAKSKKLNFGTLEQESMGGTVAHYPRGKIVMTEPVKLPIIGKMHFRETTKEVDMTEAADLILSNSTMLMPNTDCRIGSRVRDEKPLSNWPYDFTIRHAYTAGHKTEFGKVVGDGHCDMNFYGFVVDGIIVRWVIISFDEFRNQHEMVNGVLVPMSHLKYSLEKNTDGKNDFFAYDINSFKNLDNLVLECSEGYFNDIKINNLPGVPMFYSHKRKKDRIDF